MWGCSLAGFWDAAVKTVLLFCAVLFFAGCTSSPADQIPLATTEIGAPDSTLFVQGGEARVTPLDVLEIRVYGAKDLDGSYQVDPAGEIKFPLIGQTQAEGYTSFELATVLETKLGEKYLQKPQVTVRISEVNGQQFTVDGAIGRPGMYPVRGQLTLLQALALSGGPSANANLSGVIIFRTIEGQRKAARFDLRKIRVGESVDPVIFGNDLIVIDGREANEAYENVLRGLPVIGIFSFLF